jgi:hypothetical protein
MNTETIRHMSRRELVEWLESKGIAVDDPDRTDDDLRDEVGAVLASEYRDEDPPDPWRE